MSWLMGLRASIMVGSTKYPTQFIPMAILTPKVTVRVEVGVSKQGESEVFGFGSGAPTKTSDSPGHTYLVKYSRKQLKVTIPLLSSAFPPHMMLYCEGSSLA